jgi:hypothetical protein
MSLWAIVLSPSGPVGSDSEGFCLEGFLKVLFETYFIRSDAVNP